MAATIRSYCATGASPTLTDVDSADSGAIKFGRDDNVSSTTSVPIPTATGTHFSYKKWLLLDVTVAGATTISNRKVGIAASPAIPTGMSMWQGSGSATYTAENGTQGTAAGNYPADSGSNGATPANQTNQSWVAMSTTPAVYDSSSVSSGSTGKNGNYVATCIGVDNTYTAGGGTASLPNIQLLYDEQ